MDRCDLFDDFVDFVGTEDILSGERHSAERLGVGAGVMSNDDERICT